MKTFNKLLYTLALFSLGLFISSTSISKNYNTTESLIYNLEVAAQNQYEIDELTKQNVEFKRQIEADFATLNEQWDKWSEGKKKYSQECLGKKLEQNKYEYCAGYWKQRNSYREKLVAKEKFLITQDNRRLEEAKNLKQQHDEIEEKLSTLKIALKMTEYGQQYPECFDGDNKKMIECLLNY